MEGYCWIAEQNYSAIPLYIQINDCLLEEFYVLLKTEVFHIGMTPYTHICFPLKENIQQYCGSFLIFSGTEGLITPPM